MVIGCSTPSPAPKGICSIDSDHRGGINNNM